ncbi:hypothetical protein [Streptomyces sp. NBC_00620]|nr:hypothetical protein [Streptomyces sp. NBC_00620]MCX4978093.1 hypothetical protein [Streptomyces sp. NBC_00620]
MAETQSTTARTAACRTSSSSGVARDRELGELLDDSHADSLLD